MIDLTLRCPTCGKRADVCFDHGDDWKRRPAGWKRHMVGPDPLDSAIENLLATWDMSADYLGPEWVAMSEQIERLREAWNRQRQPRAANSQKEPTMKKCPTCDSPSPNRHPSVQYEGETEPCIDPFHDADTRQSEWLRGYIAEKRARAASSQSVPE